MNKIGIIIIAVVSIAASQLTPAQASLISNGSFEDPALPGGYQSLPGGSTAVTDWQTVFDGAERISPSSLGLGSACDGDLIMDINPDGFPGVGGGMQQDVATLIGQQYELSFCFSTAERSGRDGTAQIDVWADSSHGVFMTANHSPTINWGLPSQFVFVATESTTTILFSYTGPRNEHFAFIDNVVLVPVPEPSTLSFLLVGAFGFFRRRRAGR